MHLIYKVSPFLFNKLQVWVSRGSIGHQKQDTAHLSVAEMLTIPTTVAQSVRDTETSAYLFLAFNSEGWDWFGARTLSSAQTVAAQTVALQTQPVRGGARRKGHRGPGSFPEEKTGMPGSHLSFTGALMAYPNTCESDTALTGALTQGTET